jgi:hypothetical protein
MLLDISKTFIDRKLEGADNNSIKRISETYKKWKLIQNNARLEYQVSREWLPIYSQYINKISQSLLQSDILNLKKMYENFFRDPLSTGLHGMHFEMVEKYMTSGVNPAQNDLQEYEKFALQFAYNFLVNCQDVPVSVLERPAIGNPYGYKLDDVEVFPCAEYHYYYARKIGTLLRNIQSPVVMEIGGGFGGMAYYLLRDYSNIQYIGVDLPENAALQAYYLMSHFPNLKIMLWGEDGVSNNIDYDILIMPNFAIENLPENSVNLSFNSYSLAEMSVETANNYILHMCKMTKDFILHLNHVYWEVSSDNFPIDYNKFQLLFRNPTMWGKDPANYLLDQHEFLYVSK